MFWRLSVAGIALLLLLLLNAGIGESYFPEGLVVQGRGNRRAYEAIFYYGLLGIVGGLAILPCSRGYRRHLLLGLGRALILLVAFDLFARAAGFAWGTRMVGNMGPVSRSYHHRQSDDAALRLSLLRAGFARLPRGREGHPRHSVTQT